RGVSGREGGGRGPRRWCWRRGWPLRRRRWRGRGGSSGCDGGGEAGGEGAEREEAERAVAPCRAQSAAACGGVRRRGRPWLVVATPYATARKRPAVRARRGRRRRGRRRLAGRSRLRLAAARCGARPAVARDGTVRGASALGAAPCGGVASGSAVRGAAGSGSRGRERWCPSPRRRTAARLEGGRRLQSNPIQSNPSHNARTTPPTNTTSHAHAQTILRHRLPPPPPIALLLTVMLLPSPVAAHHHHVHAAGDGVVISPTASSATAIKHDLTDPYGFLRSRSAEA
ncbi:Os06g0132801, partial [Oryza sativa Japonica Group]